MNLAISMQSLKNVFTFPFRDPRWKMKLLIGSALAFGSSIIPILPALPLLGYFARLMRAGIRNDDPAALPEWDDWGALFLDGLRQFGVLLLAFLPSTVITFAGWGVYMLAIISMETTGDSGAGVMAMLVAFGIFFLAMAVGMLLLLVAAVVFPAAAAHVAYARSFPSFFRVGEWWKILRQNFLGFQVAVGIFGALYVLLVVVTQILYFTLVLCLFIPLLLIPLGFYSGVVFYRLVGQAYGETLAPAGLSLEPEPEAAIEAKTEVELSPEVKPANPE